MPSRARTGRSWRSPGFGKGGAARAARAARWSGSYTVVTTSAVDQLGHLHERMPVVLERDEWPAWLGEVPGDPAALLARPSGAAFREWRVSTQVNSVRNDGPELLAPLG